MTTKYAQYQNIVPLIAPNDAVGTPVASPWMALKTALTASFLVFFGALTSATATDTVTVTVEAATAAASGSEAQIKFKYRLSDAVGSNAWGDITEAAAAAGVELDLDDDNKLLLIHIDPANVLGQKADASHVRVQITQDGMAATLVSVIGVIDPIYKQADMASAT